jgi:hypothetical protein
VILFGEPVTVLDRAVTGEDGDGNDVFTDTPTFLAGCVFNPGTSLEAVQGQDVLTVKPTVYLPAGSVLKPTDRLIVRGDTYEVDGKANAWVSPFTGWSPGVEVHLKLVTG